MTDIPAPRGAKASDSSVPEQPTISSWLGPALAAATYLVYWQIAPRIRTDSVGAVAVSTLFSLGLIVWFTASLARMARSIRSLLIGGLISGTLVIPFKIMLGMGHLYPPWHLLLAVNGLADLIF